MIRPVAGHPAQASGAYHPIFSIFFSGFEAAKEFSACFNMFLQGFHPPRATILCCRRLRRLRSTSRGSMSVLHCHGPWLNGWGVGCPLYFFDFGTGRYPTNRINFINRYTWGFCCLVTWCNMGIQAPFFGANWFAISWHFTLGINLHTGDSMDGTWWNLKQLGWGKEPFKRILFELRGYFSRGSF